ncbi:MAG TPA: HAMP domain-containing sensor histidine kinase [Kouleothrix sp.]|uniref:sensor histidine kinase n=1 Tax=Kouleothrix sp. TaxID=2779161 RepID=UPI002BA3C5B4|nr:HAMP domain-containing sensor histidine kinase [Kouleothrix sp.]HRC74988.1 HAMP domain-containing sensor histidine kinase [Kouleothrix sp.]
MKKWELLRGLSAMLFGIAFLLAMVTVAFFLTAQLYALLRYTPPALVAQLVNALIGLFLALLVVWMLTQISIARRGVPEMGLLGPIIDALERIARGDFDVRLEKHLEENRMVGPLAQSVNTMALELNKLEAMRQEFVSNVSHEIQSPLTSIRGFARALRSEQLGPAERAHYLTIIETESMRLSKLSDNLLKLAALDAQSARFEPRPFRLDRQIRDVILACEPQWSAKSLDLDVSLDELSVTADEELLSQVWSNLIHNSIKFTPGGGSVRVSLGRQGPCALVCVADSGVGIAPADLPHVFERFFKADASRERARGGSGLGLAIAQKIVALHGGTISAASTPGAGASFTVALPLAQQ